MLKKSLKNVIGACLLLLLPTQTYAEKARDWTAYGARPLAMGNAFVSIADDYNALFYNPAGIARVKEWDGELLQATLFVGQNTMGSVDDLVNLSGSPSDYLEFFEENAGEPQHVSLNLTPHLYFKNFGFGLSLTQAITLTTHNDIDVEIDVATEIIVPIVYAHNFLNDTLSIGGTLKPRMLISVDESFNAETISNTDKIDDLAKAGTGIGVDFGLLFTPVKTMEPTFGLSITDIGGTSFKEIEGGDEATGKPASIVSSVNTGFSMKPIMTPTQYLSVSVEAHSINQKIHYSKKFHMGMEWGYRSVFKAQAGIKDGYLTGGLQIDVGLLNMSFSTYAVDYGPISGINDKLIDRRYALKLKLFI